MAKHYQIWDKVSDIYTPIGEKVSPQEWISRYGWINAPGAVPVISAGIINGAYSGELGQMKSSCEAMGATFDEDLSNEEILEAIEEFENTRNTSSSPATAEERIAAALEYQNLLSL